MTTRKVAQPYGKIIKLLDSACVELRSHVEGADLQHDERTRLIGSLDSIRFEQKIISSFERSKSESKPGRPRSAL